MAMSLERMNQKLEKILKDLDSAIEDIDLKKAMEQVIKIGELNEKTEGQANDVMLAELEKRIQEITDEINSSESGLEADEAKELTDIRNILKDNKEPFQQIENVVESLSNKGITQEDLKNYKKTQINDNLAQIVGLKENNKELAIRISNIEMRYIEKIENNEASIDIMKEIEKEINLLLQLDPNTDAPKLNMTKSNIRNKISELSSKGVDVSSIENLDLESCAGDIKLFCTIKIGELKKDNDALAAKIPQDQSIPYSFKAQFELNTVTNAKDLKDKYKEMVGVRQKNAAKITTLEAENKEIGKTIRTLEKEEQIKEIAYNKDGTEKSPLDMISSIYENATYRQEIDEQTEQVMDEKFGGKFRNRFRAKKEYYKNTENVGRFKAFFKALFTRTPKIRMIEESKLSSELAYRKAKELSNGAVSRMEKRQNDFKESIRREAAKRMVKDTDLKENDIRDDVMSKAYTEACKEDEGR